MKAIGRCGTIFPDLKWGDEYWRYTDQYVVLQLDRVDGVICWRDCGFLNGERPDWIEIKRRLIPMNPNKEIEMFFFFEMDDLQ